MKKRARTPAPRGATLIELMVALAILAVVLTVTVGLLVGSIRSGARARARAGLARQGLFASQVMHQELRMAGLGVPVPAGLHIADGYAGAGDTAFDTVVILANATQVGIVADLPRPDAQYNALGVLHNRPGGTQHNVMWETENNGRCVPDTGGGSCSTADTSKFFPGEDGCDGVGDGNDRTCPWGMRRVVPSERIQVVAGSHTWTHAGLLNAYTMDAIGVPNGVMSLRLASDWDPSWPNVDADDFPVGISGQGFVTTLDRVFFALQGTDLVRIQCRGDPDPQNSDWPDLGTNTLPAMADLALTPTGGVANVCVGPEVIAQNIASLAFTFFDAAGAATANKADVRRIVWTMVLQRTVSGRLVTQDIVGSAALRNR
ncbi:MAG: prepilin-type N-terminal cleavage/methylation domain-containing protein [Deltaproteobacteria bacterium]|nr:prepilin-type N-terminal cleavage/methylation domain-containing protein [Deltaproteobacteria bacterium]